jgi:hypothetical protein
VIDVFVECKILLSRHAKGKEFAFGSSWSLAIVCLDMFPDERARLACLLVRAMEFFVFNEPRYEFDCFNLLASYIP